MYCNVYCTVFYVLYCILYCISNCIAYAWHWHCIINHLLLHLSLNVMHHYTASAVHSIRLCNIRIVTRSILILLQLACWEIDPKVNQIIPEEATINQIDWINVTHRFQLVTISTGLHSYRYILHWRKGWQISGSWELSGRWEISGTRSLGSPISRCFKPKKQCNWTSINNVCNPVWFAKFENSMRR